AELGCSRPGIRKLVLRFDRRIIWPARLVPNAECLHPLAAGNLAHHGQHRSRVQAPTQKDSKRHLGNKAQLHTLFKQLPEFVDAFLRCRGGLRPSSWIIEIPISLNFDPVVTYAHPMSRLQLTDVLEHRPRS